MQLTHAVSIDMINIVRQNLFFTRGIIQFPVIIVIKYRYEGEIHKRARYRIQFSSRRNVYCLH